MMRAAWSRLISAVLLLTGWSGIVPSSGVTAFVPYSVLSLRYQTVPTHAIFMSDKKKEEINGEDILGPLADAANNKAAASGGEGKAATKTVNERLMAELAEASDKEKYGARSAMGKKMGLDSFRSTKTDEERATAIQEARDLNGVNPIVTLGGSLFALGMAAGLWFFTQFLAEYFALHPIESDVMFVRRVTYVFRNVVIGLVSLATGFFGVTGAGIFLLGARVAYGVAKGELDPTPLKKNQRAKEEMEMPNVWDLMMNKRPSRRGGRGGFGDDDSDPFGK